MNSLELIEKLLHLVEIADHQIPFYAYGDNEAACEMSQRLHEIRDDSTELAEQIRSETP